MKTNVSLLCHRLKPASGIQNAFQRIGHSTRFNGCLDFKRGLRPTTLVLTGAVGTARNLISWRMVLGLMALLAIALLGCVPQPTPQTTALSATLPSILTPFATPQGEPDTSHPDTPTPVPTATQLPITNTPDLLNPDTPLFPLTLPISVSETIPIDPSYRFASTQNGNRAPHHGVEFLLPFGSPVLAAADGTVLFAGDDNNGGPYSPPKNYAFYGNFIIIEHHIQYPISTPQSFNLQSPISIYTLYTLYAHLSQINVQTGDTVHAGDEIGLIGFTGAALGPHLHFEVRLNGTTYADSYNPELFLEQPNRGVLIGRILDAGVAGSPGSPIPPAALTLTSLTPDTGQPKHLYITTYEDPALALRPPFNENFALALPPGQYELTFVLYGVHKQIIEIQSGKLSFFEITVGNE